MGYKKIINISFMFLIVIIILCSIFIWDSNNKIDKIVKIDTGLIKGMDNNDIKVFLGIPYASAPVGDLRWKPPQPVESWNGIKETIQYGDSCPQPSLNSLGFSGEMFMEDPGKISEDCLTLNVRTPAHSQKDKLPVMVWIYGGGFFAGSSAESRYNSEAISKKGVILVTLNYRLGYIGFLAHPALSAESPTNTSGNYGLMDQIAALTWVKKNIEKFGGDPNKVTIFGQSAGAVSVSSLMASPQAQGLFERAIIESGGPPKQIRDRVKKLGSLDSMEAQGIKFAEKLNISSEKDAAEAMRSISWQEIIDVSEGGGWNAGGGTQDYLSVDGYVLKEQPWQVFVEGRQANIPLIIGTVMNEGTVFAHTMGIETTSQYQKYVYSTFGNYSQQVFELYPVSNDSSVEPTVAEFITDNFVLIARDTVRAHAKIQPNTYLYQFVQVSNKGKTNNIGAFHTSELPFVFDRPESAEGFSSEDKIVSQKIINYWTNFAKNSNPNDEIEYIWPRYNEVSDINLVFKNPISTEENLRKPYCDFLDKF